MRNLSNNLNNNQNITRRRFYTKPIFWIIIFMVFILSVSGIFIAMDRNHKITQQKNEKIAQEQYVKEIKEIRKKIESDFFMIYLSLNDPKGVDLESLDEYSITTSKDLNKLINLTPPKKFKEYHNLASKSAKLQIESLECVADRKIKAATSLMQESSDIMKGIKIPEVDK